METRLIINKNYSGGLDIIKEEIKSLQTLLNEYFISLIKSVLGSHIQVSGYELDDLMVIEFTQFPTFDHDHRNIYITYPKKTFQREFNGVSYYPMYSDEVGYYQDYIGNPLNHPLINEQGHPIIQSLRNFPGELIIEMIYMITRVNLDAYAYNYVSTSKSRSQFLEEHNQEIQIITDQLGCDPTYKSERQLKKEFNHLVEEYLIQIMKDERQMKELSKQDKGFVLSGKDQEICDDMLISNQNNEYQLAVLADGAGGMKEGHEAARMISKDIYLYIKNHLDDFLYNNISVIKNNLIIEINRVINIRKEQLGCSKEDLATTLLVSYKDVSGNHLVIHLGDGLILQKKKGNKDLLEVSSPENGISSNTTYLTGRDDLYDHLRIYRWNSLDVEYLLMMSDGAYPLVTKQNQKYHYLLNIEDSINEMKNYLSNLQIEDDASVVKIIGGIKRE